MNTLAHTERFPATVELMGGSPAAEQARRIVARASGGSEPVLISAEAGLDPTAVARAIQHAGSRASAPMVTVNCALRDGSVLEQEIAGRSATGGTLLLANLEELPSQLQAQLARILRDGQVEIDASGRGIAFDVRIIATVRGKIDAEIQDGRLRRELCARFGLRLDLPPLRQRPTDIPLLIGCLVGESAAASHVPVPAFSREALTLLSALPWRRNFDELREVLDVLVLGAVGTTVRLEDVLGHVPVEPVTVSQVKTASLREARLSFERQYIASVLLRHKGRMEEAARSLGIQRTNLYRKVRQLGIGLTRAK
jgi:DNA-binding NtrC family response regulator